MKNAAFINQEKEKRATELTSVNKELAFQNNAREKLEAELAIVNKELAFQNEEKENRAAELIIANKELVFQNKEKEDRAAELVIANKELTFQNKEKEKRAAELVLANQEISFQNKEKGDRAAELVIANKELTFQNKEKEKRAAELVLANQEISFQNKEKEKRATELIVANEELSLENQKKEKKAAELVIANVQKEEAEKYKLVIEEKNKSITDSINYAKRIQQAKLPRKKEIYSAFEECFVLFKPKDIVSGDFYFFHKHNELAFIAAADCTGHGVPGAFMSMICSEKLNDAVLSSTDTSEILKRINIGIKASLRQSENGVSIRDGMDIALCCVNTKDRTIKYAGANRPIWIIRNGQKEVEEIKANKKAIGGFTEDDQHFNTHTIQLQKGDTFYIFSDGYADTFGGQAGKKLTTKKLKQMLVDIQHKTLQEQEQHLNNFIENWKAEIGQVDDILVIGVRL
jgi:serine phosphatase RsbU (regulator of sigma subunit)